MQTSLPKGQSQEDQKQKGLTSSRPLTKSSNLSLMGEKASRDELGVHVLLVDSGNESVGTGEVDRAVSSFFLDGGIASPIISFFESNLIPLLPEVDVVEKLPLIREEADDEVETVPEAVEAERVEAEGVKGVEAEGVAAEFKEMDGDLVERLM